MGSSWAALRGDYNYQRGKPGVVTAEELRVAMLVRRDRRNNPKPGRVRVGAEKAHARAAAA